MNRFPSIRSARLLGLQIEKDRVYASVVTVKRDQLEVVKSETIDLEVDLMHRDAELAGKKLKTQLLAEGFRERKCVVGFSLSWILSMQVELPELPEEDVTSFLEIEMEKGFPFALENLSTARSRFSDGTGKSYANLMAVPTNQLLHLESVLRAAGLKALSLKPAIAVVRPLVAFREDPFAVLLSGKESIDLAVFVGEELAVVRSLDPLNSLRVEGGDNHLVAQPGIEALLRELKITFRQLPDGIRSALKTVFVAGEERTTQALAESVQENGFLPGMELRKLETSDETGGRLGFLSQTRLNIPSFLAGEFARGVGKKDLEFLQPRVSKLKQMITGLDSRSKMTWPAGAAAVICLLVLGAVIIQKWQLASLERKWNAMAGQVGELENIQNQIKRYRPWFEDQFQSLSILKEMTEAFPSEGSVTAKSLEFLNNSEVHCSGVARDNQSLLAMLDRLRNSDKVRELQVDQFRGKDPILFAIRFQWEGDRQ